MKILRVTEVAKSRTDLQYELRKPLKQLILHLFFVYEIKDDAFEHHIDEIYLLLSNISKWTKTNKFPTKEFIMNILWYEWQDIKDNVSLNLLDMTKITYKNFSETNVDKEFYDFLFSYFSWISQELSDNGVVRLDDVHKKINELLSK
jgi:hypothetical protein